MLQMTEIVKSLRIDMGLLENNGSDIGVEGDRHGRVQEEDMEIGDREQNNLRKWFQVLSEKLSKESIPQPKFNLFIL